MASSYTPAPSSGGYVMPKSSPHSSYGNTRPKPGDFLSYGVTKGEGAIKVYNSKEMSDALSEYSLTRYFNAMLTASEEHKQVRVETHKVCWALYNNEYDWSDKAWWQHRAPIPKVRDAVDKAVAVFRKSLLRMQPFYGIQAESKVGRTKGRYTMLLSDYWFDQTSIVDALVDGFKVGLITSEAIMKVWWMSVRDTKLTMKTERRTEYTYEFGVPTGQKAIDTRTTYLEDDYRGKLGVAVVHPANFWIVPNTNNRMMIERDVCTLNECEKLAKEGIYDKDAVEELRESLSNSVNANEENLPQTTKEPSPGANQYLRLVDRWHFWGDIYDTQGRLVACDQTFTLANKQHLIRKCRDNPFFHKNPPYNIGTPYKVPFSTYHRGMVEDVAEIAKSITQMANLIADGALYDALKAFAIDIDQLDDPSEAKQGIYPGKTFVRKSGSAVNPGEPLVQTVDVGKVPSESMNMVALFERYFQEGSYINEWVGGQGGRGSKTLGEAQIKTQSALEGLDESARNLETTFMEPTITMAAQNIYQFNENYMLPRLMENYPQLSVMLQGMQPAERYSMMIGDFSFKVRGISIMIDRQQKIGELKEILQLLSYLPGFIERLNPDSTLEEVLMPLGWDPSKLLLNPAAGAVTTPTPGAQPSPPMLPPPGMPPAMQTRNAAEGRRMGGARDNPMARGGNPNSSRPVSGQNGAPAGGANPAFQAQLMNALRFAMARNQARGLLQ